MKSVTVYIACTFEIERGNRSDNYPPILDRRLSSSALRLINPAGLADRHLAVGNMIFSFYFTLDSLCSEYIIVMPSNLKYSLFDV